jgi:DNA-directed RNA polymerase omega subunit
LARVFAQEAWNKCQEQGVHDRYEMILLAAHRARQLNKGSSRTLVYEEDQRGQSHTVNALRDFETGQLDMDELKDDLIKSMQKVSPPSVDDAEE